MATNSHSDDHGHHITPPSVYIKVLIALFILMALTVFVALKVSVPDIGPIPGVWLNNIIAVAIAVVKAVLVILFFMGVKYSTSLTKIWVIAGFVTFGLMFFILADNGTRENEPAPTWLPDQNMGSLHDRDGSATPRGFDPLSEDLPADNRINVRPRQ